MGKKPNFFLLFISIINILIKNEIKVSKFKIDISSKH
jgi:hypothetical protein